MADPQVNPNALGAPTEGFGQTVTFAFDPRGVTPSLELAKSTPNQGPAAVGVHHGDLAQANVRMPQPDLTAQVLMKAGAEILAPAIEEQRNQQFVQGVQRAMQGEAVKDIQKQQPWYSRLFGDTPAIAGARAYEVQAKVNDIVAQQTANMDKLQTLDAPSATKHFSDLINQHMSGDPHTDTMFSKAMLDQLPGLMKAQAKAYHGHTQKVAVAAQAHNMATAGAALQSAGQLYADDTLNESDMEAKKRAYIASIMPPDGINEENYMKLLAAHARSAAESGQFHVIAALKESGGWDAMSPEQQNTANAAVNAAAVKHRDRYAFTFSKEIAELRSDAAKLPQGMTPNDIKKRYDAMNAAYQKLTGSPVGLFSSDEVANGLTGTLNYLKEEEAKAAAHQATLANKQATADQKALAAQELDLAVQRHIVAGNAAQAKIITKATDDQIHMAAYKLFTDPEKPQQGTDLLRNNFIKGYTNPILKDQFISLMRTSEGQSAPADDFFKGVDQYKSLAAGTGGVALADAYFGEYAPRIARFIRMTGGDNRNPNVADAFMASMSHAPDAKPQPIDSKTRKTLAREAAKTVDPTMPSWLGGGVHLRDDTADTLATLAEQNIEDWRAVGGVSDAEAVKRGIGGAIASGRVELLGGFAIRRGEGLEKQRTLRELASAGPDGNFVAIPAGKEDDYFQAFLQQKLKAEGADLGGSSVIIHHGGEVAGNTQFAVAVSKDGHTVLRSFTGSEWQRFAAEATKKDTDPGRPRAWAFGPAITYRADPNTPSPYADDAKWAAYRAEQRRKAQLKP